MSPRMRSLAAGVSSPPTNRISIIRSATLVCPSRVFMGARSPLLELFGFVPYVFTSCPSVNPSPSVSAINGFITGTANPVAIRIQLRRIGYQPAIIRVVVITIRIGVEADPAITGAVVVAGGTYILGCAGQQPFYLGQRQPGILRHQQCHGPSHMG